MQQHPAGQSPASGPGAAQLSLSLNAPPARAAASDDDCPPDRPLAAAGALTEIASYRDSVFDDHRQRCIEAAVAALAPSTRRAYSSAWSTWSAWAAAHGRCELPARPVDVADFFEHRHAAGLSPASVRMASAAIAKAHQVEDAPDPTSAALVRHTLHRIGREGRHRGHGQVAGLSWAAAEAAASIAAASGTLAGIRDAALIRVGSDAFLRVSEIAALRVADVERSHDGAGTVALRSSKTDQHGRGELRYLGAPTVAAVERWLEAAAAAGQESGAGTSALFRPLPPARRGGSPVVGGALGAPRTRPCVGRGGPRAAALTSSWMRRWAPPASAPSSTVARRRSTALTGACPDTRCASVRRSRWPPPAPGSPSCRRPAGGSRR